MSDHELSGPPSPVPASGGVSRERMATAPELHAATSTGQWAARPSETVADRALRIALQVRAYMGRAPAMQADGTTDDGTGLSKLVYGINAKLDKAIEFIESANASAAGRKKTAGELAWIAIRWAIPFALALAWTLLSGHVSFH